MASKPAKASAKAGAEPRPPRMLSLTQLLPNLLTVAAICAGLTAIRYGFLGAYRMAAALIVLAAVLDGLDGRLARLLQSESAIGAELDSLADFLNFGVAPALVLYLWSLQAANGAAWIAVLIFAVCCALRLARFNVGNRSEAAKAENACFTGVPSPAGALLALLPLFAGQLLPAALQPPVILVAAWMIAVGLLMISRMPTPSLKSARFGTENARYVVVGFTGLVAAILSYPWTTLVVLDLGYLAALVYTWRGRRHTS